MTNYPQLNANFVDSQRDFVIVLKKLKDIHSTQFLIALPEHCFQKKVS